MSPKKKAAASDKDNDSEETKETLKMLCQENATLVAPVERIWSKTHLHEQTKNKDVQESCQPFKNCWK